MPRRRPSFIISTAQLTERQGQYPRSDERLALVRSLGSAAGLERIGINVVRLPPGRRSSWPHAEEKEEEFVYVLKGRVDAWVGGVLHPMKVGDFAAFPAGTGVCHCFINNTRREAQLLVGGEADKADNRIYYPLHPQRRDDVGEAGWWSGAPRMRLGAHDGLPDAARARKKRTQGD